MLSNRRKLSENTDTMSLSQKMTNFGFIRKVSSYWEN